MTSETDIENEVGQHFGADSVEEDSQEVPEEDQGDTGVGDDLTETVDDRSTGEVIDSAAGVQTPADAHENIPVDVAEESSPDENYALAATLEANVAELGKLSDSVASLAERLKESQELNRMLHKRVEEQSGDLTRTLLKPVFERLATLITEAEDTAAKLREQEGSAAEDFEYFASSAEEILGLYDLQPIEAEVGGSLKASVHHVVRSVTTNEQELDRTIRRVHRKGYIYATSERPFLPTLVSVWRFTPTAS